MRAPLPLGVQLDRMSHRVPVFEDQAGVLLPLILRHDRCLGRYAFREQPFKRLRRGRIIAEVRRQLLDEGRPDREAVFHQLAQPGSQVISGQRAQQFQVGQHGGGAVIGAYVILAVRAIDRLLQ